MSIKQDVSFGYEIEIRRHKALISIDKYFTRVVVPDYDVEKSRLKVILILELDKKKRCKHLLFFFC